MELVPPKEVWRLQPPRTQVEPGDAGQLRHDGAGQKSLAIAYNRLGASAGPGNQYPYGPIMKVKNFRLNVVFDSSVTALWALVYVPEGMPIGTLNTAGVVGGPALSLTNRSNS